MLGFPDFESDPAPSDDFLLLFRLRVYQPLRKFSVIFLQNRVSIILLKLRMKKTFMKQNFETEVMLSDPSLLSVYIKLQFQRRFSPMLYTIKLETL